MPQVTTITRKSTKSSEIFVWLAYDRNGFTIAGNPSKSPTGLHGSIKRPHGNASASPQKGGEVDATAGTVVETLDYYPYGSIRIDNKTSGANEKRKYAGTEFDQSSGLNYMQARYQDSNRGQFLSEDPVFLGIPNQQNISDPQSLNSYSYAGNNPVIKSDPTGKCFEPVSFAFCALAAYGIGQAGHDIGEAYIMNQHPDVFSQTQRNEATGRAIFEGSLVVLGPAMEYAEGMQLAGRWLDVLSTGADLMDKYGGGALKNKKMEGNGDSALNQIQLNVGAQNSNSSLNVYLSQPGMNVGFQPSTQKPNAMGVVYNQNNSSNQGGGGNAGIYQQLVGLYAQLVGLYQQLLTQTSNSNQSVGNKK